MTTGTTLADFSKKLNDLLGGHADYVDLTGRIYVNFGNFRQDAKGKTHLEEVTGLSRRCGVEIKKQLSGKFALFPYFSSGHQIALPDDSDHPLDLAETPDQAAQQIQGFYRRLQEAQMLVSFNPVLAGEEPTKSV